ncbi:MAG TPA: DUF2934 domain-containing protein [Isosphaeraceae bacterium]|nr:DUF2934 domain-containing protein [Isosphaeraceae bacterium]
MIPTCDQVQRTAYERWLRRGRVHGQDREDWYAAEKELRFRLNYETIVEYPLVSGQRLVLGDGAVRACRFCERTSGQARFEVPHPVLPGLLGSRAPRTFAICDECQAESREPLEGDFRRFWSGLQADAGVTPASPEPWRRRRGSLAAYKSLVAGALLVLPESELGYVPDALEWVSHPDPESDAGLFAGAACRVYSGDGLGGRSWVSLARRLDDEMPWPYLLYFLGAEGLVVQVHIPLCLRDEDLDGQLLSIPERVFVAGEGPDFRQSDSKVWPLALSLPVGRSAQRDRAIFVRSH